jgi:hypothetical protein
LQPEYKKAHEDLREIASVFYFGLSHNDAVDPENFSIVTAKVYQNICSASKQISQANQGCLSVETFLN